MKFATSIIIIITCDIGESERVYTDKTDDSRMLYI